MIHRSLVGLSAGQLIQSNLGPTKNIVVLVGSFCHLCKDLLEGRLQANCDLESRVQNCSQLVCGIRCPAERLGNQGNPAQQCILAILQEGSGKGFLKKLLWLCCQWTREFFTFRTSSARRSSQSCNRPQRPLTEQESLAVHGSDMNMGCQ